MQVLGLQNAYHGDTLGAMDCVAPSVYNGRLQAPWYRGRGIFLHPPYVSMVKGRRVEGSRSGVPGITHLWLVTNLICIPLQVGGGGLSRLADRGC